MKTLNLSFEDAEFEKLSSKKTKGENWQRYLLRLSGSNSDPIKAIEENYDVNR